jgi:spore maturation protein SpmA
VLNWFFFLLVVGAVLAGAINGTMPQVSAASMSSAKSAVELALALVGQMALWLGFMRVLQEAGLMRSLARVLAPLMRRLFPEVPADHPAMGAMILNLSANMLGLGNAATPFGIKAMVELNKLNTRPGVATNAMALFLAINTSGVAVLPLGAVAMRATLGSTDAAGIIVPTLIVSFCSTLVAIAACKLLSRLSAFDVQGSGLVPEESASNPEPRSAAPAPIAGMDKAEAIAAEVASGSTPRLAVMCVAWVAIAVAATHAFQSAGEGTSALDFMRALLSGWLLPILMLAIVSVGFVRKVKVYEAFIAGAKEAFQVAIAIIPFLVAILVAIGMFRASGAMESLTSLLSPLTALIGMPADALPMALIRPLSGSGALAVMTETMRAFGPDSLVGYMVSIINGSTETTFYVLAVYFGAVGVRATRHTVACCLSADITGIFVAVFVTRLFFGG